MGIMHTYERYSVTHKILKSHDMYLRDDTTILMDLIICGTLIIELFD